MTPFETISLLLTFTAVGSYINLRYFKLPASIGLMTFALVLSLTAIFLNQFDFFYITGISEFIGHIDFSGLLLHGILSILLFAGALHIDFSDLKKHRVIVLLLATFGVIISTAVIGILLWYAGRFLGISITFYEALAFGALISPTDPVAVLGILKETAVSKGLRIKIGCESLLNDGMGVVVFLAVLGLMERPDPSTISINELGMLFVWQGLGSIILGLTLGWITFSLLRKIDDYKVEVMLTLALATGSYSLAEAIHVSAPITVVVAGLFMGNHGRVFGMSDKTRQHLDIFWKLLDEILNALLFMLIGLEMIVISLTRLHFIMGLAAILATLIGRVVSVSLPVFAVRLGGYNFEKGTIPLLTWGGLRGGISIALALSLPASAEKDMILGMTYIVVLFSVLFQGTTFRHAVHAIIRKK